MKKVSKKCTVSVILPVFNNEKTIIQEIVDCKNILNKYCEEFEILVGEDKSTDNTRMLLKGLFGEDPSVRLYFNGKNKGIAENMKQLYRLARFRYILLYSADGEWGFGNIEALLKSMLLTRADMVIGKRVKKQGYTAYRLLISYLYNTLPR